MAQKKYSYNRTKLISKINVARIQCGLSDQEEAYRAMLENETGKRSLRKMTAGELLSIVRAFKARGWEEKSTRQEKKREASPQAQKIYMLWQELHAAGAVKDKSEKALNAFIKKRTNIDSYMWLPSHMAVTIIESLKQWLGRLI